MARGRPRKADIPSKPSLSEVPTLDAATKVFNAIYGEDRTKIQCGLCDRIIEDGLSDHLKAAHTGWTVAEYERRFLVVPLEPVPPKDDFSAKRIRVTAKEAEEHPGGREGAMTEKQLPFADRQFFRDDILSTAKTFGLSLPVGFQVVQLAHLMVLARRCRSDIEDIRSKSDGKVWDADLQAQLKEWNEQINKTLRDLEKVRKDRPSETENPMNVIEEDRKQAEIFVQQRLGELQEVCPDCGIPITLPALPHWAFEPIETAHGRTWMVWSQEMWWLVLRGAMRVWQMALILRTSPEFLQITARRRGQEWPLTIDMSAEERLLRSAIDSRDAEARLSMAIPMAVDPSTGVAKVVEVEVIDQEPMKQLTAETQLLPEENL